MWKKIRKRWKGWRRWKKILIVVVFLIIVRVLLFESFSLEGHLEDYPNCEKYENYMLFKMDYIVLKLNRSFFKRMYDEHQYLMMFQWQYDKLIDEIKKDLYNELNQLMKDYRWMDNYAVDEESFSVDIYYYYHYINYSSEMWRNKDAENLGDVEERIRRLCDLWYYLSYQEAPGDKQLVYMHNTYETDPKDDEEEIIPTLTPPPKESAYNQNDLSCLKEILFRGGQEQPLDLENPEKIVWSSEQGGYIRKLYLSKYDIDISGELDLTGFLNLEYVSLKGMNISKVILPDTINYIDQESFDNCKRLEEITIPTEVREIHNPAFSGCESLKKMTFEGSAPNVKNPDKEAFGEVSGDFKIYREKHSKGWMERCWEKYDIVEME